jgi:hypothetical protein
MSRTVIYEVWRDDEDEDTAELVHATSPNIAAIRYCMREVNAHTMLRGVVLLVRAPGETAVRISAKAELQIEAAVESDIAALDRSAS